MALFDDLFVPCPHCGEEAHLQSYSAYHPCLNVYRWPDVPDEVLGEVRGTCRHCGYQIGVMAAGWRLIAVAPSLTED